MNDKAKTPRDKISPKTKKTMKWRIRHRVLWWLFLITGSLISVLVVLLMTVFVVLNTHKGQCFVAQQIGKITNQRIIVKGIRGSFPNHLAVASITFREPTLGNWLTLENIKLDWSAASIFRKKIYIDSFYLQHLKLAHLPPSSNEHSTSSALPKFKISAQFNTIIIENLDIEPSVSPVDLHLSLRGKVKIQDVLRAAQFKSIKDVSNTELSLHLWERNAASRLDVDANVTQNQINQAFLKFNSYPQKQGVLERLLASNQLLPIELAFSAHGPFDSVSLCSRLSGQGIFLNINGLVDFLQYKGNLIAKGNSSALHLLPQISWSSWNLDSKLYGNLQAPEGEGRFELKGLQFGSSGLERLVMQFKGSQKSTFQGKTNVSRAKEISFQAQAEGLQIPSDPNGILKANPIQLHAQYQLKSGASSLELSVDNKLISLQGALKSQPDMKGQFFLTIPQLRPLGALAGVKVEGSLRQTIRLSSNDWSYQPIDVSVDGPIHLIGGEPIFAQLIGDTGTLALNAQVILGDRKQYLIHQLNIKGQHLAVNGTGQLVHDQVNGVVKLSIDQLSAVQPFLKGNLSTQFHVLGSMSDPQAHLQLDTQLQGIKGNGYQLRPSQINVSIDATHLVTEPKVNLFLKGSLDNAPIYFRGEAGLNNQANTWFLKLPQLKWRSLGASADVVLSQKTYLPMGKVKLEIANLSDFNLLLRQKFSGFMKLELSSPVETHSSVLINAEGAIKASSINLSGLSLKGSIEDPLEKPRIRVQLRVNSIQVPKIKGGLIANANGSFDQLKLNLQGNFSNIGSSHSTMDVALLLNLIEKKLILQHFIASIDKQNIRLLSPALLSFGQKVALDRFRVSLTSNKASPAFIEAQGQIKPDLNFNVALKNLTPDLITPLMTDFKARGVVNAQADLHGQLEKPTGTIKINGHQLAWVSENTNFIPPAELNASATLENNRAQVNAQLIAGKKIKAVVQGKVPLNPNEQFSLQTKGFLDVSLANALLGAYAQQAKGMITLAMQVTGTFQRPILRGNLSLEHGSFRDFAQGININAINGSVMGMGDRLTLQSFDARAGEGTLHASGQIGILQNNIPIDLMFSMRNAKPLSSDLLTAVLDSDISIKGLAKSKLKVQGDIKIKRADINIPRSVSRSVVVIKVVRPDSKVPVVVQSNAMEPEIGLNLTLQSAGPIIVRGFGLFSNMAGSLTINGTAQAPQISGGFAMRNGRIDLGGISLSFTRGVIGFNGSSVDHKIDPTLDFEVKRSVDGYTPTLKIIGYASSPKIELTSSPPISQDRILSMLLFGVDSQSLSATQMAEIGVALATLGGQGSGFDPIGSVRKTLGLDRLSIGSAGKTKEDGSSSGTSVSAGKYITKGFYLGAKQSTGNAGTQAEAQIDITKHLKATATVGAGHDNSRFVTPDNDPGSSIGLLYQFNY